MHVWPSIRARIRRPVNTPDERDLGLRAIRDGPHHHILATIQSRNRLRNHEHANTSSNEVERAPIAVLHGHAQLCFPGKFGECDGTRRGNQMIFRRYRDHALPVQLDDVESIGIDR